MNFFVELEMFSPCCFIFSCDSFEMLSLTNPSPILNVLSDILVATSPAYCEKLLKSFLSLSAYSSGKFLYKKSLPAFLTLLENLSKSSLNLF